MLARQKTEQVNGHIIIVDSKTLNRKGHTFTSIPRVRYGLPSKLLNGTSHGIKCSSEVDIKDLNLNKSVAAKIIQPKLDPHLDPEQ
jgi:hypothetical protein